MVFHIPDTYRHYKILQKPGIYWNPTYGPSHHLYKK